MAKTTLIKKEIEKNTSFLYDRKEVVTAPMWPNNSSSLYNIYTSSNQPHHQKIYYRTIFSDKERTGSLDVDFSIAYGHYAGSGSSTGSYGLISSSATPTFAVSESKAIYSQYRNMLYDYDKRKYLSDGKFRFFGLTDVYLGVYGWEHGNTIFDYVSYSDKLKIPDVKSFELNEIKAISCNKAELDLFVLRTLYFITKEGRLFQYLVSDTPSVRNVYEFGIGEVWKDVSVGKSPDIVDGHLVAIKEDGTLWSWGRNEKGQRGVGYISTDEIDIDKSPVQIGKDSDWEKVYAGPGFSFAIKTNGELYAWGDNQYGILGLGGTIPEYYPTRVGTNTWKKISIGNVKNGNESLITVFGIDTLDRLWAWGDNSNEKINIDGFYKYEPVLLDANPYWYDVSCGEDFVIAIYGDDRKLYGWGYSGMDGELLPINTPDVSSGENIQADTVYNILDKKYLTNPGTNTFYPYATGWKSVSCGADFSFAINSFNNNNMSYVMTNTTNNATLWCWGKNDKGQLQIDTNSIFARDYADMIWVASPSITGWDLISVGSLSGAGAINTPNPNVNSMVSDDIYVINFNRWNFKDKVDAGNWQLSLRTVFTGSGQELLYNFPAFTEPLYKTITLVDESVNFSGTEYDNPMYDVTSKGGPVYGVYRGTLEEGIDKSAEDSPYGLFFPENGIIILNGEMLLNSNEDGKFVKPSIIIETKRTPASGTGSFTRSSNADLLYASIKGAMELDMPFIANTVETKMPTYCFIRINNEEFNYSTNPTLYARPDSFLLKDKFREVPYPFTYITTIGLYNDNDDLLAVAKLSRPILKTQSTELVVKVKLDI
jgi:hypothetical protein